VVNAFRLAAATATLLLFTLPVFATPALASTPYVAYVSCSPHEDAAPSHACRLGEQLGARFELRGRTEASFQTCFSRGGLPSDAEPYCVSGEPAYALTPLIVSFRPTNLGSYEVSWRVEGNRVASWDLNVISVERPLTRQAASGALRNKVLAESPGARFLGLGRPLCPRIYQGQVPRSLCFAEYQVGKLHSLVGYAVGGKGDRLSLRFRAEARWLRRWVRCPLHGLPGTLVSNNNCGYHQPQNDEDLLRSQALEQIRAGRPLPPVRWTFAESSGFAALGLYRVKKAADHFLYRNSLGDAFRYRP
jgi:hypothetical protein